MSDKNEHKLISLYPQMFMGSVWVKTPNLAQKLYNGILLGLQLRYTYFRKFNHINGINPFHFGFECGDGWVDILSELILKIKELDTKAGVVTEVIQIKEKFGGLRFYPMHGGSNEIWKLITEYEQKSYEVCEESGSTKDVGLWTYGWLRTISKTVAEDYYQLKVTEGRLPNGIKFEDCWKPVEVSETIVLNQKMK
jgi:hypothetical protein